ncbi:WD40/YVTN/BNR-like repeat-containing protein [Micromonospora sp. NPDC004704]
MPEPEARTPLDAHLARGRTDLLDRIEQPPLARIRHRAARRRRRGRGAAGGALAALAVTGTLLLQPWTPAADEPPPVAQAPPGGPVYTDDGITINGLNGPVTSVPGTITDIEFTDPDHGYLLSECVDVEPCPASVARTEDGGGNWQVTELPGATRGRTGMDLLAFPDGRLAVTGDTAYTSVDGGRTWRVGTPAGTAAVGGFQPGDRLRGQAPGGSPDGDCGETVRVWRADPLADVGSLPVNGIGVCWVATDATADGGWWIGGTRDGHPVAAVTRDGGATWTETPLDTPDGRPGTVRVGVLGNRVYAVVLGPAGELRGVFQSTDGGGNFTRTSAGVPAGGPDRMTGDPVPLLDGRLLLSGADNGWYVSTDDGRSFGRATGNLPEVGRLARTDAGYVAYDLFVNGWVAYSADGSTWRKLQIR